MRPPAPNAKGDKKWKLLSRNPTCSRTAWTTWAACPGPGPRDGRAGSGAENNHKVVIQSAREVTALPRSMHKMTSSAAKNQPRSQGRRRDQPARCPGKEYFFSPGADRQG